VTPAVLALGLVASSCGSSPTPSSEASALVSQGLSAESAGKTEQAKADFLAAAAKDRSDAVPYYELGALYQRVLHDSEQAQAAYKQALMLKPNYRSALFNLAVVDTPSTPQAAENLYNEIILHHPKDARALFNLGVLLIQQNQPVPGHQALKKALSLDPSLSKQVPAGITP
jgi:Flp pilus assembly protein TadD